MKMDSKKILTIGAGAVVGYLIFCKFMKRAEAKSLEEGGTSEEGGFGGGGGRGFSPMPILPIITPVVAPVVTLPNTSQISRADASISNVQSGNSPIASGDASANVGRETPPTPPPPPSTQMTDVSGAVVSSANKSKFADFDGDANFQDQLL